MKTSWRRFYRRVASLFLLGGATAWSSAVGYAQQLAFDSSLDAAYNDGWQEGDNGGFGLTPWNFDNDFIFDIPPIGILDIDDGLQTGNEQSSTYNDIGRAWRMGLVYLDDPMGTGAKDIVRAGRGLATPLRVGQTLSIVLDSPSAWTFNDGFFLRLSTGGGNICYYGDACTMGTAPATRFSLGFYNWFPSTEWGRWGATSIGDLPLFTTDTDAGMRMDFKLTGEETFELKITPLDNPGLAFTGTGTLEPPAGDADFDSDGDVDDRDFLTWQRNFDATAGATRATGNTNPPDPPGPDPGDGDVDGGDFDVWSAEYGNGPINWIEFVNFAAESNTSLATDFYIKSIEVSGPASTQSLQQNVVAASCGCGSKAAAPSNAVPEPGLAAMAAGLTAAAGSLRRVTEGRQERRERSGGGACGDQA